MDSFAADSTGAAATAAVHIVAAAAGFASTAMLWLAILLGILLRQAWALSWIKHNSLKMLHMCMAIFGLALGVVHGLAQLAAPTGYVRWIDEIVPFINPAKPVGVGLGTLALEVFVSIVISVPMTRKIGLHNWRIVHSTAYAGYTLVAAHMVLIGSEVKGVVTWATIISWVIATGLWLMISPKVGRQIEDAGSRYLERKSAETTVEVDPMTCARFGFCEHEAPSIFRLSGDGKLSFKANISPDELEAATKAAKICPARAIKIAGAQLPMNVATGEGMVNPQMGGMPDPDSNPTAPIDTTGTQPRLNVVRPMSVAPQSPQVGPVGPPVTAARPRSAVPGAPPPPPVPGQTVNRPPARLGPFPPAGPGRRPGQQPESAPPLRSVPQRPNNVTGLRPRGGA